MDVLGSLSYLWPVFGEWFDLIWAPVSAYIFYKKFGSKTGTLIEFTEELLPYTDILPTFTIMYFYNKVFSKKKSTINNSKETDL